jgi:hypothetical protein
MGWKPHQQLAPSDAEDIMAAVGVRPAEEMVMLPGGKLVKASSL